MSDRLWERQASCGETPAAYRSFVVYRDLGPGRTLDAVSGGQGEGKRRAAGRINDWSSRYRWVERVAAWDDHLQAQRDVEAAQTARLWEQRRLAACEDGFQLGRSLQLKVQAAIKLPIVREVVKTIGGRKMTVVEPIRWGLRDLAIIARISGDLVNESIGAAIGKSKSPVDDDAGDNHQFSPEQMTVMRRALAEAELSALERSEAD